MKNVVFYTIILALFNCKPLSAQEDCSNSFLPEQITSAAFYGQFKIPQNPGVVNVVRLASDFDLAAGNDLTINGYAPSWAFPPHVNADSLSFAMVLHSNSSENKVGESIDTIAMVLDSITDRGTWTPPGSQEQIAFSFYHLSPSSEYTLAATNSNRKFWIEILLNPPTGEGGFAFWENATVTEPSLAPLNFNNNNSGWLTGVNAGAFEELIYKFSATCKQVTVSTHEPSIVQANLYPNPTSGIVTIDVANKMLADVIVYDILGAVVSKQKQNILDLTNFDNGIYIVETRLKDGTTLLNRIVKK